ncbi:hypothetical protein, partial [Yersinia pestis]|uniref:hypothetical protein n=1 Tax=Yersinia pestis TaxID=632 RepID=UPI0006821B98
KKQPFSLGSVSGKMPGRHRETARYRYEVSLLAGKGFGGTARKAFLYSVIWLTKTVQYASFHYASR